MNGAWLEELLPKGIVSPRFRILWLLFFLLFPLAYFGGVRLGMKEEQPMKMRTALDRAAAIKAAERFAESKGISVAGWSEYVIVENHDKLLDYYKNSNRPDVASLRNFAPGREITVLFRSPDRNRDFRTYLSLLGPVTGYDMGTHPPEENTNVNFDVGNVQIKNDASSGKNTTMQAASKEAETIALRFLVDDLKLNEVVDLGPPY